MLGRNVLSKEKANTIFSKLFLFSKYIIKQREIKNQHEALLM